MAKSAVTELTDHIESIRQEAYNEGYAAAMRAVAEFSTTGSAKPEAGAKPKATAARATSTKSPTATTAIRQRRAEAKPATRIRRGDIARLIAEAMLALPNHSGPAAAIKKALAKKSHDIPYATIRRGLDQLQTRGDVSVAEDGRTWSYAAPKH